MRDSLRTNVEFAAQIAIAIAVLVVAGVIVKRHVFPERPIPQNIPGIRAGDQLHLQDVDWKLNQKTLVFFLNKDCHYCTTSAPFYRQLIEEASKQNVRSLAVFPNSPEEAQEYIRSIALPIVEIRTGPLSSYKIAGTPTVVLVDGGGSVEGVWVGDTSGREKRVKEEFLSLARRPAN